MNNLFAPLSGEYCLYFYWLSVFFFVFFILASVSAIYAVFMAKKNKLGALGMMLPVILTYFVMYFQNRLLNSMCGASLASSN